MTGNQSPGFIPSEGNEWKYWLMHCLTQFLSLPKPSLHFKEVSISDILSRATHESLDPVVFILETKGERYGKDFPLGPEEYKQECGCLEPRTTMCQHWAQDPKGQKHSCWFHVYVSNMEVSLKDSRGTGAALTWPGSSPQASNARITLEKYLPKYKWCW